MDSDRRHELEKNDLEVWLRVKGPEFLQKHAANLVLGVVLIAALILFVYNRQRNREVQQMADNQNTAIAYQFASEARELLGDPVTGDEAARARQQRVTDAIRAADAVISSDAATPQKAAAQLSKAEVYWALANAPATSLATTQPVAGFAPQSSTAYLEQAERAYTTILADFTDQKEVVANALLSLAAVAENRRQFDDAAKWYGRVVDDTSLRSIYRDIATARLKMLGDVRKPIALAPPASQPTTLPTAMGPSFPTAPGPGSGTLDMTTFVLPQPTSAPASQPSFQLMP